MSLTQESQCVPIGFDADGVVRVSGTRVTLDTIVSAFNHGATSEEIHQQYPSVPLADVYLIIAYYLNHHAEVDEYLSRRQGEHDAVKAQNEAENRPDGVRERLLARQLNEKT